MVATRRHVRNVAARTQAIARVAGNAAVFLPVGRVSVAVIDGQRH
jgi:hypothetical protein